MSILGLSHLTFVVADLDRATRFFVDGLGAQCVYASAERQFSVAPERFFLLGGLWIAVMQGEAPTERSYRHVAFAVAEQDLDALQTRLESSGVEIRPGRPRVEGEGHSLYFYDFDNHLFELHTGSLNQRLERYAA